MKKTSNEFLNKLSSGFVIWFYGLPSAGKTTLANALQVRLSQQSIKTMRLDGDVLRKGICSGLGFDANDRKENIRRAAHVAKLGSDSGVVVIASLITPNEEFRDMVEDIIGRESLFRVFVSCPIEECVNRDVKGLYRKAIAGSLNTMTGIDATFEQPGPGEFFVDTSCDSVEECMNIVLQNLEARISCDCSPMRAPQVSMHDAE